MERNGQRRMAWLALLASLVLALAGCKSGGGGEGSGSGAEGGGEQAATGGEHATTGGGAAQAMGGEDFSLAPGFAAMSLQGRSGGTNDASSHGPECVGNIASSPDHTMTVSGGPVMAMLAVASDADTTLVVLGPGGPYCNDDFDGLNPGIQATFQPGEYQVFVGNYSSDEGATAYTLNVSPATPEPPPTAPTMPMMPPMAPTGAPPAMPPATPPAAPTTAPTTP